MAKVIIKSNPSCWSVDWRELWEYRDLLGLLVQRDLTAIYKQTILGPLWFIIQSLLTTVVLTVIFGRIAGMSTDGIPQFIFFMAGTTLWTYTLGVFTAGANSLSVNASVLSKVYFPRLIIPLSGVFSNLAQLALNYGLFAAFYLYFLHAPDSHMTPSWLIASIPLIVIHCALIGFGFGLWVAALTIKYRDLRFALPFLSQLWMYASAVVFPASAIVNPYWKLALWLNPLTALMELHRYAFTGHGILDPTGIAISLAVTILMLVSGTVMFNRSQQTFVDTI